MEEFIKNKVIPKKQPMAIIIILIFSMRFLHFFLASLLVSVALAAEEEAQATYYLANGCLFHKNISFFKHSSPPFF